MQSPLLSIEAHKEIINALVPVRQGNVTNLILTSVLQLIFAENK